MRQPPGLFLLFAVEMWERFSFYGMRAILVLFLADAARGGLGLVARRRQPARSASTASAPTPSRCSAATWPTAGWGRIARWSSARSSSPPGTSPWRCRRTPTFFLGLALVAIGTGFFKPNVSTMVGQLYQQGDPRRDGGFTIFYMGVNVGALLGQFVCGYLGESPRWGWHYGFGAAGVGMLLRAGVLPAAAARTWPASATCRPARRRAADAGAATRTPLTRDERDRWSALLVIIALHDSVLDGVRAGRLLDELLRRRAHRSHGLWASRSRRRGSSR